MGKNFAIAIMISAFVLTFGLAACGGGAAGSSTASGLASSSSPASAPLADEKAYTIARVDGEVDWGEIVQLDIDDAKWTDSFGICAHAQLCYDDQALYVRMWAEEQAVRATYAADDPLAKCYEDSCMEFFLAPIADDARYMNFEFNPNCAVCNEIGTHKEDRIRLLPGAGVLDASSALTNDGWEIAYRIPFDYIRTLYPAFEPESGMQMRGNFYKCGNLTANKHYLAWNPVDSDTPNFHVPKSFGVLVLE